MNPYQQTYSPYNFDPLAQTANLDWNSLVVNPLMNMVYASVSFIPNLVEAFYILIFAWLIGKFLQLIISALLKAFCFNTIADKIGLTELIHSENGSKKITPSQWLGVATFWLTICVALVMAFNRLRLNTASQWLDDMVSLLISIFTAVTILTLGIFLSEISSRLVGTSAKRLGVQRGEFYCAFIRFGILFFTLILTLTQFHVPSQFVLIGIGAILLTLCVTFAIAFGFGGSAWAAKVLEKIY
jgi:hypothetical protein